MTVAERPVEPLHRRLGVTDEELDAIRDRLGGRDPNDLELAMFSVMWSEHCSYKSSRPLLRTLPTGSAADGVVAGPGENAGVIDIGDGLAVAFKIESHNHPSAVEPTQGAATGVGGILRDIFTMGARPIAVLDALRFGDPSDARTRHLVDGVVRGVGGYGNCVGVPTVGGELVLPTGDEAKGFGAGTTVLETHVLYDKALPRDAFVQFQGVLEFPHDSELEDEAVFRAAIGKTWTADAPFGRSFTPILEALANRELESGATTEWDVVPQVQISLSKRQHVLGAVGIRQPITDRGNRPTEFVFYLLWDWFDGGVLEGW